MQKMKHAAAESSSTSVCADASGSASISRRVQCCSPDAGGEEGDAGRGEAARSRCQPIRAAERQERTTMGHQGLTWWK